MASPHDPGSADRTTSRHDDERPTVIFLHIGKTAGTTLRKILYRNFDPSEVILVRNRSENPARLRREETPAIFAALPEEQRTRARLVLGHVVFGIHEHVPRPFTYITLLRRPEALVVSQYRWVRREPSHWLHRRVLTDDLTLDDYLDLGLSLEVDNGQTRAISGDTTTPFGECSPEMLERARANLDRWFSVVGLTERFDESLLLLGRAFGWAHLAYTPANFSAAAAQAPVSAATRERIENLNRLDNELYEYATARMQRAIEADPELEVDLRRFRRRNAVYRRTWGALTYSLPRRVAMRLGLTKVAG